MGKHSGSVLLVDDDEYVLLSMKMLFDQHFTEVTTVSNPEKIPSLFDRSTFDVVVLDMNFRQGDTTGNQGRFWLKKILGYSPETQVILITAYADVEVAVESIKEGALDFIVKPWQNEKLLSTVKAAYALRQERKKVTHLKDRQKSLVSALGKKDVPLIGSSPSLNEIRRTIEKVAPTSAEVLILGENGTGKEVIARELHRLSDRSEGVFVTVDVGAISESLFESELFGHRKGAFTDAKDDRMGRFEAAAGGTLFLDEIGNLSPSMQARLLTVLQHKKIVRVGSNEPIDLDVRIVCATNSDLSKKVKDGSFREDLYYRINTVAITLPPLRERPDDIAELANYFLNNFRQKYDKPSLLLDRSTLDKLRQSRWPGNVRELQHAVERAVILCDSDQLTIDDFDSRQVKGDHGISLDHYNLSDLEAWAIRKAIAKHGGNISHAANELGLSRGALYRRMQAYGI